MTHCSRRTAVVGLLLVAAFPARAGGLAPAQPPIATLVGSFAWLDPMPGFGGFSGLELSPDGADLAALSDRGFLLRGRVTRDAAGVITGVDIDDRWEILSSIGKPLGRFTADSEGLARAPQGGYFVSFEGLTRVARITGPHAPSLLLPRPDAFAAFPPNSSLEALAVAADGTLYTLPEGLPRGAAGYPVWRFRNGGWDQPFAVPARGDWLRPVGADIGPDGRLYLLERQLALTGFSSRVRRFDLTETGLENEVTLLETAPGTHGNLEGIAVWQDGDGAIRLTMVSDNNRLPLFTTELVDYRID